MHQPQVSTHSRPKAAAKARENRKADPERFNTQPPEGGCLVAQSNTFQFSVVSTHSRPKAAAKRFRGLIYGRNCFNTQPPEGGCIVFATMFSLRNKFQHTAARRRLQHHNKASISCSDVSTHSRPKAAALKAELWDAEVLKFQHTAARRRLQNQSTIQNRRKQFQHTAARRRLL